MPHTTNYSSVVVVIAKYYNNSRLAFLVGHHQKQETTRKFVLEFAPTYIPGGRASVRAPFLDMMDVESGRFASTKHALLVRQCVSLRRNTLFVWSFCPTKRPLFRLCISPQQNAHFRRQTAVAAASVLGVVFAGSAHSP